MNKQVVLLLIVGLCFASIVRADYVDVYANGTIKSWQNITIYSTIYMNNGTPVPNANVTYNFTTANLTQNTTGSGTYNTTFALPPGKTGEFNITVWFNNSNKTIPVFITNISFGSVSYIDTKPPFATGSSFLINVSMFNLTNNTLQNYTPVVEIFKSNGPKMSWTITNTTSRASHNGNVTYNITIPSSADGGVYGIGVDRGATISYFYVKSGFSISVNTQTNQNETKADYTPGSNFSIVVKFKDSNGNPISNATNVTAVITLPNGSTTNIVLKQNPDYDGYYNTTYTTPSGQLGAYSIEVTAQNGSTKLSTNSAVNTQLLKARMEPQKEFFREWGDSSAFTAGGQVALNVIVVNITDDSVLSGANGGGASIVNCAAINITSTTNVDNGSTVMLQNLVSGSGGIFFSQGVCKISFTAPNSTGNYKLAFNATVGSSTSNTTVAGIGFVAVQKYILKPSSVSSLGGFQSFAMQFVPGDNATFQVSAYDLNAQTEVSGVNITNLTVTKIKPLDFGGGTSEFTNVTISNITAGTATANPTITIVLPVNRTGPQIVEITAIIRGSATNETVTGTSFYFAKYVMGWLSPNAADSAFEGMGGGGGSPGGSSFGVGGAFSCSAGKKVFKGSVFDVKSNGAAENVEVTNITFAREELTGKNIKSCLTITSNKSDSTGQIAIPVTFESSCGSLSGFYFIQFNATYNGNSDTVESGVFCKNFNFFPSTSTWRVGSRSNISITVNGITRLNDSRSMIGGSIKVIRAFNYNPSTGGKVLTINGTINASILNGLGTILLVPNNFSSDTWPQGFISLDVQYTANASDSVGSSDTQQTGFQSTPFDVFVTQVGGSGSLWGQTFRPGQTLSVRLSATANVSRKDYDNNNTLIPPSRGFAVKVGIPWEGRLTDVTPASAVLLKDQWNHSTHSIFPNWGAEEWEVNFTLPSRMKKGWNQVEITVNNSNGETASTQIGFEIAYFNVKTGVVETVYGLQSANTNTAGVNATLNSTFGISYDNITQSYNVRSKSGIICYQGLGGLRASRFSEGGSQVNYNSTVKFLVLDNTTAGVYDTVVWNSSGIVNITQKFQNWNKLYVYSIDECSSFQLINATYTPSWNSFFDSFGVSTNFSIPYIVKNASTGNPPSAGMTISINGIIKQMEASGSSGGKGFDSKLDTSLYTSISADTDSNGIAFVRMNVTRSGSYQTFWKINDTIIEDTAKFSNGFGNQGGGAYTDFGTQINVRAFTAFGQRLNKLQNNTVANAVVTLYPTNSSSPALVWNNTNITANATIWNGTFNQSTQGSFFANNIAKTVYVIYDPVANITYLDDDINMNASADNASGTDSINLAYSSLNSTFAFESLTYGVSRVDLNKSNSNTAQIAFYRDGSGAWFNMNATTNLTVKICAQTFTKPASGISNVAVYIYGESYGSSQGPARLTTTPLNWYDPINSTLYNFTQVNATTGPNGCVALDVAYPGGWPQGSTSIKGTLTRDTGAANQTEAVWIDSVWRQYV
ncbi:MAG: hypothetical protein HY513_01315 [Candidatus Aenigmarchaeota archaeon]|nr:hypothetical protein [Candidatus Aenigmarchaeota archaeon]